ncbi:CDP-glucose 4,6-dehydratase [Paracoccus nototheniae]|uniref:CDP-glucose 4,6-dehydratase n=1 Tax=Paracoccus nototheniae TaxID=2489002 RepID=A0ABW4E050_9RHOB|nr:CDP-glucose 4,6-dehydratase [Paracoccus nototheniae]
MIDWSQKRVLVTGHTGFKGAWLSEMLLARGVVPAGLALAPDGQPALFDGLQLASRMDHAVLDIRDGAAVTRRVRAIRPDIVFHLAAQPLVRQSYRQPVATWATNVMGTACLLEALTGLDTPVAVVVVTTDKVYAERDCPHGYRETDRLGGHDPYAASKAAVELLVDSWRLSFAGSGLRIATARAGNVIGGGDRARDRILADLAAAFSGDRALRLRNPGATRPWQHVLDPLAGYLALSERLSVSDDPCWQQAWNFGPDPSGIRAVRDLATEAQRHWPGTIIESPPTDAPHEAARLSLCIDKARSLLGWQPQWPFARAVAETVSWYRDVAGGACAATLTRAQIARHAGAGAA